MYYLILLEEQALLGMPGIEIQDISLEENTQLFEKLVHGFGKLGVVTLPYHHHPLPSLYTPTFFKIDLFFYLNKEHQTSCLITQLEPNLLGTFGRGINSLKEDSN